MEQIKGIFEFIKTEDDFKKTGLYYNYLIMKRLFLFRSIGLSMACSTTEGVREMYDYCKDRFQYEQFRVMLNDKQYMFLFKRTPRDIIGAWNTVRLEMEKQMDSFVFSCDASEQTYLRCICQTHPSQQQQLSAELYNWLKNRLEPLQWKNFSGQLFSNDRYKDVTIDASETNSVFFDYIMDNEFKDRLVSIRELLDAEIDFAISFENEKGAETTRISYEGILNIFY